MDQKHKKLIPLFISIFVIAISTFFLFFHLGHYALWDDEANTALFGQSVWETGDTNAILGHNIIAFNNGGELKNLKNRYISPLQYYIVAPFAGLFKDSAFAVRFPFALFGLLTIILVLFWMWKSKASLSTWLLMSLGLICNVSLMLFFRQCRYYGLTIFLATLLAYLYFNYKGKKRELFFICLVSFFLLTSNYLCFAATYSCLIVDYFIWGKKDLKFKFFDLTFIAISQLILGLFIISIYNPFDKTIWNYPKMNLSEFISFKWTLFLWNLRDMIKCEFGPGILLMIAPLIYIYKKNQWILRLLACLIVYCFITTVFSPQPPNLFRAAIVRYTVPLILVCIFLTVMVIQSLTERKKWLIIPIAILAFSTNIFNPFKKVNDIHFSYSFPEVTVRSTIFEFIHELIFPNKNASTQVSKWINNNVIDNESILIFPKFSIYPLMFHAPKAIYAWQLKTKTDQFKNLPNIHFDGLIMPDYIIVFGPDITETYYYLKYLESNGIYYETVKKIDTFWYDLTRPELYWHSFREWKGYSHINEVVYIFKKTNPINNFLVN